MATSQDLEPQRDRRTAATAREQLLAGIPVTQRRLDLAGIATAVLEGGDGPPMVLLHGPGESAVNWRWILGDLASAHRVVAPDLPAHGDTAAGEAPLDADRVLAWLGELIERTCASPPILVGHVLGGAIAARFAARHPDRIRHLILVDTLGLAPFRPSPKFALSLMWFQAWPTERTYGRFMRQCAHDLDALRDEMGPDWQRFMEYNLALAKAPNAKAAGRLFREVGLRQIPPEELETIRVPTTLIWGREDRANRLRVAEDASKRYGWPLHVIERAADDPPRDQPRAFVETLRGAITRA